MASTAEPFASATPAPASLVVGVTGHRTLRDEAPVAARVDQSLRRILQSMPQLGQTPLTLTILSPLAEGADRLVAKQGLQVPGSRLEVALPLPKDEYLKDFETGESRAEFESLLAKAVRVHEIPRQASRLNAYYEVGRFVVDHCDVLIAIWDGKPAAGHGGTAEVVQYARASGCPLLWIRTDGSGGVTEESVGGVASGSFQETDRYNAERVASEPFHDAISKEELRLLGASGQTGLPAVAVRRVTSALLPHLVRADLLALRFQRLYYKAGSLVYALAAAAVAAVAFQILFKPTGHGFLLVEVGLLSIVLAILGLGRRQHWHRRWIDYRFLAERFRSALFLAVAKVDKAPRRGLRQAETAARSGDWISIAFSSAWDLLPRPDRHVQLPIEALKQFLLRSWIDDQINYHRKTSLRHQRRHRRLAIAGNLLFGLTFAAAVLHVAELGPETFGDFLAFVAIAFPATAGALGAIRLHREYLRNSVRSAEMARHLESLRARIESAADFDALVPLLRAAEETMLHENEDWRVVVRFHDLESPA